jgi:hypothetical protein
VSESKEEKKDVTERPLSQFRGIANATCVTSNGFGYADPPAGLGTHLSNNLRGASHLCVILGAVGEERERRS